MAAKREFDVVLFGATGYSAGLMLQQLAQDQEHVYSEISVAIAGRSRDKLQKVKDKFPGVVKDIIIADSFDESSMKRMTERCSCLLNTVGPYVKYGESAIKACLETNTDYVDIGGETGFMYDMQMKYDAEARKNDVCICMAAGFDSVASDVMFYHTTKELSERYQSLEQKKVTLETVVHMGQKRNFWKPPFSLVDGVSNGTFTTILHGWKTGEGINIIKNPVGFKAVENGLLKPDVHTMKEINKGKGLATFPCEIFSDAFIVRTSYANTLQNEALKPSTFEYGQYFGTTSILLAYFLVGFLQIGPYLIKIPGMHYLLNKLMDSGEGPSEESRANLKTNLHSLLKVYPEITASKEASPLPETTIVTEMELTCDNYTFTAVSALKCALLIVKLRKQQGDAINPGILSPISAIGGKNLVPELTKVLTLSKL